jgi:3-dehydroquinate synthase
MNKREALRVKLGTRGYDILVGSGLLGEAGALIAPVVRQKRAIIVTDENVAKLHLARLQTGLDASGIAHRAIVLPPGEATKDFAHFSKLCDDALALGIERGTPLIALGGGVIGDLTGFAAATLLRGLDYVQVPTTLLSQVDSSVGGKTAIDSRHGKNLIGAFHQPVLVLADIDTLSTLPRRELLAGYAEVVKYGLIRDRGFYEWLETAGPKLVAGDIDARRQAVLKSCAAKAAVVAIDERETGERQLLNFGHTFGHALEAENGFGEGARLRSFNKARPLPERLGGARAAALCGGRTAGLPRPDRERPALRAAGAAAAYGQGQEGARRPYHADPRP